jgi:hypothetical protein
MWARRITVFFLILFAALAVVEALHQQIYEWDKLYWHTGWAAAFKAADAYTQLPMELSQTFALLTVAMAIVLFALKGRVVINLGRGQEE